MTNRVCTKCGEVATHEASRQWFCVKHFRFRQMRSCASSDKKAVPSNAELHALLPENMECQDCGVVMVWLSSQGRSRVITLQHYRDGSFGLVCLSCNARHVAMPGDSYRDMPKDHKRCPTCEVTRPLTDFYKDNSVKGPMKVSSYCKGCASQHAMSWRRRNNDKFNAYRRERYKRLGNSESAARPKTP